MTQFSAFHGSTGLLLVMAATFFGLTLYNLAVGPRRRFAWNWGLGPQLMDDALNARGKLAAVCKSGWGIFLLALDVLWIVTAAFS